MKDIDFEWVSLQGNLGENKPTAAAHIQSNSGIGSKTSLRFAWKMKKNNIPLPIETTSLQDGPPADRYKWSDMRLQ